MSIIVLGAYSEFLGSALVRVEEELGETVVFWSAPPSQLEQIRNSFPKTVVQDSFQLARADTVAFCNACGIENPSYEHLSREFIDTHSYEREYVLHNLLHRADPGGGFTHEEIRDTLNNYFLIAQNLLNKYQPKLVYMEVMPHVMYDLAIYLLAKRRGIKTLMIGGTHIAKIGYVAHSIGDSLLDSEYYAGAQAGYDTKIAAINDALTEAHKPFYMDSVRYSRGVAATVKGLIDIFYAYVFIKINDYIAGQVAGYEKTPGYLQSERVGRFGIIRYAAVSLYHEWLYRRFVRVDRKRLQKMQRYVYVPLSLQHEATTMPAAGMMYDQKAYITLLSSLLPTDVLIVVKENPKQFINNTGILNRSRRFYSDLRRMGVVLADLDASSDKLISEALFTVVTTGTAGFESIYKYHIPVLAFSKNWYIDMPGVTLARNYEDVCDFVRNILDSNIFIDSDSVNAFIEKMKKRALFLYHDGPTVMANGWDHAAMGNNLYSILEQELRESNGV